jgi:hypothetical protein
MPFGDRTRDHQRAEAATARLGDGSVPWAGQAL